MEVASETAPITRQVTGHVSTISYRACRANADVVLYVIVGGGHTWPGSTAFWPPQLGLVTTEIAANDILWSFGLESAAPDVLLVDLGLPDIAGLEVVRFAANRYPGCDILIVSIFGDEANVLAALEAGARGYLLKGSLQRDIVLDIREIRNGGSPLSPIVARQLLKRLQAPRRGQAAAKSEEETRLTPRETEILNAISRGSEEIAS